MNKALVGCVLGFGVVAFPSVGTSQPSDCYTFIAIASSQTTSNSCFTYTDCDNGNACVAGSTYQTCGTADTTFPRICRQYTGGSVGANGRCTGGSQVGNVYQDGTVNQPGGTCPPSAPGGGGEP